MINYDMNVMSAQQQQQIINEWNNINYVHDSEYIIRSRFKGETSHIPGLDEIFNLMIIDLAKKSPLEELKSRADINGNGKYTNISQLKESE